MFDTADEQEALHLSAPWPKLLASNRWNDLHVMPGAQTHRACAECWCGPDVTHIDHSTGGRVFTHHERPTEGN